MIGSKVSHLSREIKNIKISHGVYPVRYGNISLSHGVNKIIEKLCEGGLGHRNSQIFKYGKTL